MKIVIDGSIPFVKNVFEPYAEVVYRDGAEISNADVRDADALLIRTRTKCNAALLDGSRVKIISAAAIGTDNIDVEYCSAHGIFHTNAAGCYAGGVMNYVFSALYGMAARKSIPLSGTTFGIIGVGNCGSRVERMARSLGFKVLLYDPPRAETEKTGLFCRDLGILLENSDIVSLHVPLNAATRKMAGEEFFERMKMGAFFINTSRGEIVDEDALMNAIPKLGPVALDAWCNEPDINTRLMQMVDIATPHIAGYSQQGKQNGATYAVRTIARFFDIKELLDFFPKTLNDEAEVVKLNTEGKTQGQIASIIQYNYPVFTDDFMFRTNPKGFKELRKNYQYRKEFYVDNY